MPTTMKAPPAPITREKIHNRTIQCEGYHRSDGLWDIEGKLVDTKSYGFDSDYRGRVEAGTPIHDMGLRLTIDESMEIHAVEAFMDHNPYPICPQILSNFQQLVGLRIAPGFRRQVHTRLGGVQGCTHLVELLGPLATTAFQTLAGHRRQQRAQDPGARPRWLNSCHAHASDSDIVRRIWPEHYKSKSDDDAAA